MTARIPVFLLTRAEQLLTIWCKAKGKERDALLWGDEVLPQPPFQDRHAYSYEVEYLVVQIDDAQKKARLSLCQADVLKALAKDEELSKHGGTVPDLQGQ
jgi:glutamate--cysteine ligase catalytic subunit